MNHLDVQDARIAFDDSGTGELVMLLHAGYVDRTMWDGHVAHLAERFRVITPDARTHGDSSTAMAPFRHCDDIAALIRQVDQGPAVLIGVSMGAGAAIDTALEHPELVRAVVVSGAGTSEPTFEDPWELGLLARLQAAIEAQDVEAWITAELEFAAGPSRTLAEVDPTVVDRLRAMHERFVATHIRPGVVPPTPVENSWARLPEVAVPVLGVVGELDGVDHHRMCATALDAVSDGRGVVSLAGAGHYPNLEQPSAWDAALDAFLADVVGTQVATAE